MSTLKQLSNAILTEKNSKIIPGNIRSGVEIFDVTGNYTGSGALPDLSNADVMLYKIDDGIEGQQYFPDQVFLPDLTTFPLYYDDHEEEEEPMEPEWNVNLSFTDYENNEIEIGETECMAGGTLGISLTELLKTFPFYVGIFVYNGNKYQDFRFIMADKNFSGTYYTNSGNAGHTLYFNYLHSNTTVVSVSLYLNKLQVDECSPLDYVTTNGSSMIENMDDVSGTGTGTSTRILW